MRAVEVYGYGVKLTPKTSDPFSIFTLGLSQTLPLEDVSKAKVKSYAML